MYILVLFDYPEAYPHNRLKSRDACSWDVCWTADNIMIYGI